MKSLDKNILVFIHFTLNFVHCVENMNSFNYYYLYNHIKDIQPQINIAVHFLLNIFSFLNFVNSIKVYVI